MRNPRLLLDPLPVTAALLAAAVFVCGCATNSKPMPAPTFRVMTYNIHHAEGLDGKVDLQRIAELIKREGAGIVALQEVDKGVERTQRSDLPAELAALTGMTCIFSNNFHHQGGEYGNAVLTKFPVKRWTNLHYEMLRPGEQRGLLQLVLDVHGRELVFLNTHIDYRADDAERWVNLDEIEKIVEGYRGKPLIMGGDFNDTPESRVYRRLNESLDDTWKLVGEGDGWTIPSSKPRKRIDYLWITKDSGLVPLKTWVPKSNGSDHLPVVAEFQLK